MNQVDSVAGFGMKYVALHDRQICISVQRLCNTHVFYMYPYCYLIVEIDDDLLCMRELTEQFRKKGRAFFVA